MRTRPCLAAIATFSSAALLFGLAGCVGPSPAPGPVTFYPRMFVANYANGGNASNIVTYAFPYANGSTPNTTVPSSGGPNGANGLAIDIFDNLFVANAGGNAVIAYLPTVGNSSTPNAIITSGMATPMDLTFDSAGKMYVANFTGSGSGDITQYLPAFSSGSLAQFHLTNGVNGPTGIVFDGVNTMYVANKTGGNVAAYAVAGISSASTPLFTITSHLSQPVAVAVDRFRNLYVADAALGQISVFNASATIPTPFSYAITTGVSAPRYVSFDASGNLYVSNAASITIYQPTLSAASAPIVTVSNGLSTPAGVGFGF